MILNNAKYGGGETLANAKRERGKRSTIGRSSGNERGGGGGAGGRNTGEKREREDISDTRIEEKGRADEIIGLSRAQ